MIERKLPVSFDNKNEIYDLIYILEDSRTALIYGNASKEQIELILKAFNQLKRIMIEKLHEEGETIE